MLYCLSLRVYVGTKKGVYSDKLLRLWIESKGQKDIPIDAVTEWKRPTLPIVGTPATRSSHASNEKLARQQHEARTPARKRSRKTEWEAEKKAEQARQMFLFSCFTGLAIADMERLKFSHIQIAADGRKLRGCSSSVMNNKPNIVGLSKQVFFSFHRIDLTT